jgi:hypothetical protein
MVKMLNSEEFLKSIGRMMKVRMNMSQYNGCFECACGKMHQYSPSMQLLAQGRWRVVIVCPDDINIMTNVSIKTGMMGLKFKGFESISGIKFSTETDRASVMYVFSQLS